MRKYFLPSVLDNRNILVRKIWAWYFRSNGLIDFYYGFLKFLNDWITRLFIFSSNFVVLTKNFQLKIMDNEAKKFSIFTMENKEKNDSNEKRSEIRRLSFFEQGITCVREGCPMVRCIVRRKSVQFP